MQCETNQNKGAGEVQELQALQVLKNNSTVVVTGKAVNHGDGEGMQVRCTLHFKGAKRFIDILKNELRRNIL